MTDTCHGLCQRWLVEARSHRHAHNRPILTSYPCHLSFPSPRSCQEVAAESENSKTYRLTVPNLSSNLLFWLLTDNGVALLPTNNLIVNLSFYWTIICYTQAQRETAPSDRRRLLVPLPESCRLARLKLHSIQRICEKKNRIQSCTWVQCVTGSRRFK